MTLTLAPETETRLRTVAAQRGLAPEDALAQVLAEATEDFEEAVAGIREGLADVEAGRTVTLEDHWAAVRARRQERDARNQARAAA